jgi:hypothetical protein
MTHIRTKNFIVLFHEPLTQRTFASIAKKTHLMPASTVRQGYRCCINYGQRALFTFGGSVLLVALNMVTLSTSFGERA